MRYFIYIFTSFVALYMSGVLAVYGQINTISIVSTYTIVDEIYEIGDIVSRNTTLNTYTLARVVGDEYIFERC